MRNKETVTESGTNFLTVLNSLKPVKRVKLGSDWKKLGFTFDCHDSEQIFMNA